MKVRTLASIGSALVMVLFVAVGVRADAPAATYYACVNESSGVLRMVSANTTCGAHEQPISWNQTGPQGPMGPQGPAGPQGPQGVAGLNGANGVSGYTVITKTQQLPGGPLNHLSLSADCPSGEHAIGGGFSFPADTVFAPYPQFTTYGSAPVGSDGVAGDGWTYTADAAVGAGFNSTVTVYAICATVG